MVELTSLVRTIIGTITTFFELLLSNSLGIRSFTYFKRTTSVKIEIKQVNQTKSRKPIYSYNVFDMC